MADGLRRLGGYAGRDRDDLPLSLAQEAIVTIVSQAHLVRGGAARRAAVLALRTILATGCDGFAIVENDIFFAELTVQVQGSGTVTADSNRFHPKLSVSVPDIACRQDSGQCGLKVDLDLEHHGVTVTLVTEADPGWTLSSWSRDCTNQGNIAWPNMINVKLDEEKPYSCIISFVQTNPPPPPPPPPAACNDLEPTVDSYIRGGLDANTNYGSGTLLVKGTPDLKFARKTYLVFDLATVPANWATATLELTLHGHSERTDRVFNLFGVIDGLDWNPAMLGETAINWTNGPRNDPTSGIAFLGEGLTATDGIRLLVSRTLPRTDPQGTVYKFDVSQYLRWARGGDPAFSSFLPAGDADGLVTLLLAHAESIQADDGSDFFSRESTQSCERPRIVFQ